MIGDKLLDIVKKTSVNSGSDATDLLFGKVTSVEPLKIKVDNRFEITSSFIVLTSAVSDFSVDVVVAGQQQTLNVKLALNVGENVLLLRTQNGQRFIIIDRVR